MKRFVFWRRTLLHFLACSAVAFGMLFLAEERARLEAFAEH
jgi:hypothetical protein